jgi:5-methylcytosine-specific restriction endonuclease McrA
MSDFPGSLAILVWAEEQACKTPAQKLILFYLADNAASRAVCRLDLAKMAAFCCTTEAECEVSLWSLQHQKLIQRVSLDGDDHIALPWWRPAPQRTVKTKARAIESGVREFLHGCQGGECWYCGTDLDDQDPTPHIDHQHPKSRGGSDDVGNLVLACAPCNVSKRDKTVGEFKAYLIDRDGLPGDYRFHGERAQP